MPKENENLISIDELILRAKNFGVYFGKGDPKNRLRYLVKIGLLPHAQRKSFNGLPPEGSYPESVLKILIEIDKKLKEGKSVQDIKRELAKEKEEAKEKIIFERPEIVPIEIPTVEKKFPFPKFQFVKKFFSFSFFFKIFSLVLFFMIIVSFAKEKINFTQMTKIFLASVNRFLKIAQVETPEIPIRENISAYSLEPYLTINAETVINPKLKVSQSITSPTFIIEKGEFLANILTSDLTAERTYTFPDQSGIVCLSTGNCIGLAGEVTSAGGTPNRLAKFTGPRTIGNSSISDLFAGVSITINALGNVGIGTTAPRTKLEVAGNLLTTGRVGIGIENPLYSLHVLGQIQATGDICTDLAGGKCLSQIAVTPPVYFGGGGGIGGSGTAGYLPIWTSATALGNSIVSQSGSILNVAGTAKMTGFQLTTGAHENYILTSDASGFGTWQPAPTGTLPAGSAGQTLRHDGTNWVATDFLYNSGSAIGIGTTTPMATLAVAGSGFFSGPLTIETTNLPQLILKYNDYNYLRFSLTSTSSEIFSSSTLMFNSLTGEMKFFDTSIKKGDKILRASIPILKFPVASQTNSTSFVSVTGEISPSTLNSVLPIQFPGSQRKFAFLINFADNIPTISSSTWRIDFSTLSDVDFEFPGQNLPSLETGLPHLKDDVSGLLEDNWVLKVNVPDSQYTLRIFNIFLLCYDQIQ
jgi:hypothetical protein